MFGRDAARRCADASARSSPNGLRLSVVGSTRPFRARRSRAGTHGPAGTRRPLAKRPRHILLSGVTADLAAICQPTPPDRPGSVAAREDRPNVSLTQSGIHTVVVRDRHHPARSGSDRATIPRRRRGWNCWPTGRASSETRGTSAQPHCSRRVGRGATSCSPAAGRRKTRLAVAIALAERLQTSQCCGRCDEGPQSHQPAWRRSVRGWRVMQDPALGKIDGRIVPSLPNCGELARAAVTLSLSGADPQTQRWWVFEAVAIGDRL